jgi:outer membrane protein TolC
VKARVLVTGMWLALAAPWTAAQTALPQTVGDDAAGRLAAVQRAALERSPGLRVEQAGIVAGAAALTREAASGSPYLEWQSEGLDGSGRQLNAADYLRVGTPFNLPGQIGRARELVRTADGWVETALGVAALDAAAEVSRRWLELAAAVERGSLAAARLQRLDDALSLQEARYQLGEIAGAEVRQLDLEHVGQTSRLAGARSEVAAAEAAVRQLAGDGALAVRDGDLAALTALSRTPEATAVTPEDLGRGPLLRRAEGDAGLERSAADLMSATAWGRAEIEAEWERIPALEGLESYDAWGFRIAVPLPLGAAGRRQREEARALADRADAGLEVAALEVRRRAEAALAAADGAASRLRVLEPALAEIPQTDHSLSEQFRLGAISYLGYIDGLSRFDRIVEDAIDARLELLLARLELALLLGDPTIFPLPDTRPAEEG